MARRTERRNGGEENTPPTRKRRSQMIVLVLVLCSVILLYFFASSPVSSASRGKSIVDGLLSSFGASQAPNQQNTASDSTDDNDDSLYESARADAQLYSKRVHAKEKTSHTMTSNVGGSNTEEKKGYVGEDESRSIESGKRAHNEEGDRTHNKAKETVDNHADGAVREVTLAAGHTGSDNSTIRSESDGGQEEPHGSVPAADVVVPPPSLFERRVEAILQCHKERGKKRGVNHYFKAHENACVPFPAPSYKGRDSYESFIPPTDPTLVPLISTISPSIPLRGSEAVVMTAGRESSYYASRAIHPQMRTDLVLTTDAAATAVGTSSANASVAAAVRSKSAPSLHSRWLLDDWRLWEGELPCSRESSLGHTLGANTSTSSAETGGADRPSREQLFTEGDFRFAEDNEKADGRFGSNQAEETLFVSSGAHNHSLPNSIYKFENICVDEDSGSLIVFSGSDGSDIRLEPFQGISEHPFGVGYSVMERFLHKANREVVRGRANVSIHVPMGNISSSERSWSGGEHRHHNKENPLSAWKKAVSRALLAYITTDGEGTHHTSTTRGSSSSPVVTADVLFVEDNALLMPLGSFDYRNPGHMFHRVAPAISLSRILGARTLLFLSDFIGLELRDAYRTLLKTNEKILAFYSAESKSDAAVIGAGSKLQRASTLEDLLPSYLSRKKVSEERGTIGGDLNGGVAKKSTGPRRSFGKLIPTSDRGALWVNRDKGAPVMRPRDDTIRGYQLSNHRDVATAASFEARGRSGNYVPFLGLAGPLFMSGERGCEAMRCGVGGGVSAGGSSFHPFSSFSDLRNGLQSESNASSGLLSGFTFRERTCSQKEVADLRRCGRRYAAINVALRIPHDAEFAADTQNRSASVWNRAVKETFREAKRLRRDVWLAKRKVWGTNRHNTLMSGLHKTNADPTAAASAPFSVAPPAPSTPPSPDSTGENVSPLLQLLAKYDWYMGLWRSRLVHVLSLEEHRRKKSHQSHRGSAGKVGVNTFAASSSQDGPLPHNEDAYVYALPLPQDESVPYGDYFREYFAYRLEYEGLLEDEESQSSATSSRRVAGEAPSTTTRQLICYKNLYVSHNHFQKRSPPGRGGLSQLASPNCNERETFKNVYEAGVARYGSCASGESSEAPLHLQLDADIESSVPFSHNKTRESGNMKKLEDEAQVNNTAREAHPLFTLSPASRERLQKAFSTSQRVVEGIFSDAVTRGPLELSEALLSDIPLIELRVLPFVSEFIDTIEKTQREYDALFMEYFKRRGRADEHVGDEGRPIALFYASRTGARQVLHTRPSFTRLLSRRGRSFGEEGTEERSGSSNASSESLIDFIDFAALESLAPTTWGPSDDKYDPDRCAHRHPRSVQFSSYLTTDIYMGLHGSDMHGTAFMKPSGLAFEFSMVNFETGNTAFDKKKARKLKGRSPFSAGYFSQMAYAKQTGYLRIIAQSMVPRTKTPDDPEKQLGAYLSIPEWRHVISNAVCSWLSFNAVRLADGEAVAGGSRGASKGDASQYAFLIPWWCRGSALETVEALRRVAREHSKGLNEARKGAKDGGHKVSEWRRRLPIPSFSGAYLARRSLPSGFGFSVPMCPAYAPTGLLAAATFSNENTSFVFSLNTTVDQERLNRIQNECVMMITLNGALNPPLRLAEGFQSLLEAALLVEEERAAALAQLVTQGARQVMTGGPPPGVPSPPTSRGRSHNSCGYESLEDDEQCARRLVGALLHPKLGHGVEAPPHLVNAHSASTIATTQRPSAEDSQKGHECAQESKTESSIGEPWYVTLGVHPLFVHIAAGILREDNRFPLQHSRVNAIGAGDAIKTLPKRGSGTEPPASSMVTADTNPLLGVHSPTLRSSISDWIVWHYFSVPYSPLATGKMPTVKSNEFSYGSKC